MEKGRERQVEGHAQRPHTEGQEERQMTEPTTTLESSGLFAIAIGLFKSSGPGENLNGSQPNTLGHRLCCPLPSVPGVSVTVLPWEQSSVAGNTADETS